MAPCGFLQPSLKEHATISTLINPGKLIGHLRVVNSGHRREPRKAAGPPRAPGSCWRERVFLKLQLIFFFLNHLEVALLFGAGKVGRWVLCFCVNPSAWPLVAPLPLRKAQLSFSSAVEEGTFLFVFCACLSVVFLSLRSSQANSEKKKKKGICERFHLDRSHNTFRNVNFSCFHENTKRSHFEGTMVEIKAGGSVKAKAKGERQLGRLSGNLCCS